MNTMSSRQRRLLLLPARVTVHGRSARGESILYTRVLRTDIQSERKNTRVRQNKGEEGEVWEGEGGVEPANGALDVSP